MVSKPASLPSVAVCLAAYNGMLHLQEQMDSILGQVGVALIIFASVDLSTDGTEEWFGRLASEDDRIVLLPLGERFGGAAGNFFRLLREVDFSDFDYVALADQDDIWLPGKLQRAVGQMTLLGMDGYSSDILAFWESGRSHYVKKSYPQRRWDYLFESAGPGCTFVISHNLAADLQAFLRQDPQKVANVGLHDWFIYAWARAHGYKWVIDDHAGMQYRQHGQNQVGVNAGLGAFLWRVRRVLNGWGLSQVRLIAGLVGKGDDSFVRQWKGGSRLALLVLVFESAQCRRRPLDRVWFAVSCIALALIGWN